MRQADISRETKETRISLHLNLDGAGQSDVSTGVGFLDHMLTHIARHGLFDLAVSAQGDLHIDAHHTVEDIGICLGKAFAQALAAGPKGGAGLARFGHAVAPMDEALGEAAVDISGRPFLVFQADFPQGRVGEFDAELVEEFFRAFAVNARVTLHLSARYGNNVHHMIEGMFKAFARAMREAVQLDPRVTDVPSTKGMLEQ